jgi:uncharacterized protein involved in exopolysaccharide biosynthesis
LTERIGTSAPEQGFDIRRYVIEPVIHRWKLVLGMPVAFSLLALTWQAVATPKYTASTVVTATSQNASSIASRLGQLGGLAALAGSSLGASQETTEFDKFEFMLTSPRLGDYQARTRRMLPIVFDKKWDSEQQAWARPEGAVQTVKNALWPLFGLPAWLPPDGQTLAEHYDRNLQVRQRGTTGLFQLSYTDEDPERALMVLQAIVADSNELLRQDAARRAAAKAAYLRSQLETARVAEYRVNLATLLATEEQTLMLTATSLPYAADTVQPYTVSAKPTSQRPVIYGAIAFVLGASLGLFFALVLGPKQRMPEGE